MYCSNCGNQLSDKAVVCPKCGCIANKTAYDAAFNSVKNENSYYNNNNTNMPINTEKVTDDKPNPALSVLSFFLPLFGIIVYFADRHKTPVACKRYLLWSILNIVLIVLFYILYMGLIIAMMYLTESA